MDECQDLHLVWRHLVDQAITVNQELPDVWLVEFGNQAAALAVDLKRRSRLERLDQQVFSGCTRILGDLL